MILSSIFNFNSNISSIVFGFQIKPIFFDPVNFANKHVAALLKWARPFQEVDFQDYV